MKSSDPPVIVEQVFNTSLEAVWKAISNLEEMKQWYFDNIDTFKPKVGWQTQFAVNLGNRTFTHLWEVTNVIPKQKITYNWRYKEYPGISFVTFELFEEQNKVRLRLSAVTTEDFPSEIPEFKRESCEAGWKYFIEERLYNYLANK